MLVRVTQQVFRIETRCPHLQEELPRKEFGTFFLLCRYTRLPLKLTCLQWTTIQLHWQYALWKRRNLFTNMRRAHDNIRWTSADARGSTWKSPSCSFVLWQIRSLSIVPRYADRLYTHTDEPTQSVLLAMHESFCINKAFALTASTSTTPKTLLAERQNISKALPIIGRIHSEQPISGQAKQFVKSAW